MTKRIWFKPDCVRWINEKKKSTTFRSRRHEGIYDVVRGSWFKPEKVGLTLRLTPIAHVSSSTVIKEHFASEGPFRTSDEFIEWLKRVRLYDKFPEFGWLHRSIVCNSRFVEKIE